MAKIFWRKLEEAFYVPVHLCIREITVDLATFTRLTLRKLVSLKPEYTVKAVSPFSCASY